MFFFDELVNVGIHVEQIGVLSKLAIGEIEGAALLAAESGDGSAEGVEASQLSGAMVDMQRHDHARIVAAGPAEVADLALSDASQTRQNRVDTKTTNLVAGVVKEILQRFDRHEKFGQDIAALRQPQVTFQLGVIAGGVGVPVEVPACRYAAVDRLGKPRVLAKSLGLVDVGQSDQLCPVRLQLLAGGCRGSITGLSQVQDAAFHEMVGSGIHVELHVTILIVDMQRVPMLDQGFGASDFAATHKSLCGNQPQSNFGHHAE